MKIKAERLTDGPNFHWFGYYDKFQTDPSDRFVLAMKVGFEGRSPCLDDTVKIGVIDIQDNNKWTELGETNAWNWQQGCMLQWVPDRNKTIIWNDRENASYVSRLLDIETGERTTLPFPIYSLSPDGKSAVTTDFRRIQDMRPGYGYPGIADPDKNIPAPDSSGISFVDMETQTEKLIISIKDIYDIPVRGEDFSEAKHYFNHLLINPDGTRFVFLHRWRHPLKNTWKTRMLTADMDGSDIRVVNDSGIISHFNWKDPDSILMFTNPDQGGDWGGSRFYLINEADRETEMLMDISSDGHCSYLPDMRFIICDSYPLGENRCQQLYLFDTHTRQWIDLGAFHAPESYAGEWRCDLHPRVSRDGKKIFIDSTHEGLGRQIYMLDISAISNGNWTDSHNS